MKSLSRTRREIAHLDRFLKPIADQPVDNNDSHWVAKLEALDPLALAGVKAQAQDLISEILSLYVDGTESEREELRAMFREFDSFAWAAAPREPTTSQAGLRAHLVLLSIRDQGRDPRDAFVSIDGLKSTANQHGLDFRGFWSRSLKFLVPRANIGRDLRERSC